MSFATSCLVANLQIGVAAGAAKEIVAAGAAARNHFYVNTLTWKAGGDRLLPCKNFTTFMGGHLELKKEFAALLTGVGAELADKFYARLDIDHVPEPEFVLALPELVAVRVMARMGLAMQRREARATEDLWSRLIDPLTHFANKMESGETFRDATIRNLVEAVELLPRMNFADDQSLGYMLLQVREQIIGITARALRKDRGARVTAASESRRILNEIERIRG